MIYTYLGIHRTFAYHEYTAICALKENCQYIEEFQKIHAFLWLFDTLVVLILLYAHHVELTSMYRCNIFWEPSFMGHIPREI